MQPQRHISEEGYAPDSDEDDRDSAESLHSDQEQMIGQPQIECNSDDRDKANYEEAANDANVDAAVPEIINQPVEEAKEENNDNNPEEGDALDEASSSSESEEELNLNNPTGEVLDQVPKEDSEQSSNENHEDSF